MNYEEILAVMREKYRELSGFDADQASDIGIRLKVLAAEIASAYEKLSEFKAEIFPQTSTGKYLEYHAATRALIRKPAIASKGILRFSRETPSISDIPIPAGICCATGPDPLVNFETISESVLPAGELSVDVESQAVDAGIIGNVAPNAVLMMVSPAAGITGVTNPHAFTGGVDEEDDESLRSRLLAAYQNISNGTNCAFYYDLAMSHEGVSSVNVLPRRRGRGTVDVVAACRFDDNSNEIIDAIGEDLAKRKEINVDVLVTAAIKETISIDAQIAVKDSYSFPLTVEKSKAAIEAYINSLSVGQPLYLAAIGNCLLAVDGVYNYNIVTPVKDIITANDRVLRSGTVSVSGMAVG